MELETTPSGVPTLNELRARYVPQGDHRVNDMVKGLQLIIPLSNGELIDMLESDEYRASLEVLQDAYATARFLRSNFDDTYPKEAWAEYMRKPGAHFQDRSVVDLFRVREFENVIERYHKIFSFIVTG